ncbi:MAG: hypothetical protein H0W01_14420, partial [Pseudonocardiales bacterium]|nr:hypothetical protein [Pseudonocardiales bacterium]
MSSTSRRLQLLSGVLAVCALLVAVWAVGALRFALTTRDWPSAEGTVIRPDPAKDAAAVRYRDSTGREHLMALTISDTDDLPVGSVIRIVYHVGADGLVR